jgi:hypothetical protein
MGAPDNRKSGFIEATATPQVVNMLDTRAPVTITLNSVHASKLIEISTDMGANYFTPTYDPSNANQLIVALTADISHMRLTGAINDRFFVL